MGMCKPSNGKKDSFGRLGSNIKTISEETPNTRVDFYDEETGELLQQRWYGPDGTAIWDKDGNRKLNNPKRYLAKC